jgi:hypothetical protein
VESRSLLSSIFARSSFMCLTLHLAKGLSAAKGLGRK